MNETTFQILNAAGTVIYTTTRTFNHKRYSQKAAAQQKFLDSLYVTGAAEARLIQAGMTPLCFRFVAGRSQHYFPKS